ncbi:hypothetical protein QRD89_05285 [Halobacillus sp. ACCC02827]|uniref:hypothetical protein n=1 Tax=Halobacillus sp. ACCC02827 TaxID=3052090 RepID=UPI002570987A|nr:hypothetical protein [Halobacillus sp. ACCC02827]WJE16761.1 hypothetical protein QRD89_05285 [Halobacillus sp. ACCC02827]
MQECSACNGWGDQEYNCPRCPNLMKDEGRAADYFDDYSPYLDQNATNLVDGVENSGTGTCVHLFVCDSCGWQDIRQV